MINIRQQIMSEAHKDYDPSKADPSVRRAIEASNRILDKSHEDVQNELGIASAEIKAKYKIEIFFGPKRTLNGPNLVLIYVWESGKKLHGGGDDLMFWCLDNKQDSDLGCGKPIPSDCVRGGMAICPHCQMAINADRLTQAKAGRVSTRNLSKHLAEIYYQLNGSADIYCKYDKRDPRVLAQERDVGADKARKLKGLHIYPLKNIIKDTAHGANVADRFFAFLTA